MATVRGTAEDDFQIGTDANDRIVASPGRDVIDGRGGFDFLDYRNAPSGIVDHHGDFILPSGEILSGIVVSDGFGFDDLLIGNLEGILGSQFDDVVLGDENDNRLFGFAGDDRIRGGEGDNFIDGGKGHDTLTGGRGDDHLVGRGGDDVLIGNDDPLEDNSGSLPADQDRLIGMSGNDVIIDSAEFAFAEMRGGSGDDTMYFNGALSVVHVFGEQGNDTAIVANFDGGGDVDGGWGHDVLRVFGSTAGGALDVTGGPGDDTIEVIVEDPTIRGGTGDDTISGFGDPASVFGDDGNDILSFEGTAGLSGGRGDDLLINANSGSSVDGVVHDGGPGNDVLRGGEGADEFVLADRGADIIENFVSGEDTVGIEDTGLSFGDFDTNGNAQLDAGDNVVTVSAGDLSIDIAAAAGFDFLRTATVVDTPTLDEIDVMFG